MFTGIVTARGVVASVERGEGATRIAIDGGELVAEITIGGSIAVDGVCLTAVGRDDTVVTVEAVPETLARTTLGGLVAGDGVNLERPVGPGGLFEGHIVQGHVDTTATVRSGTSDGDALRVWYDISPDVIRYIVEKGSVAVDGVSLTVSSSDTSGFEVTLIPHTMAATGLGSKQPGDLVNVEIDIIAKYVERLVG